MRSFVLSFSHSRIPQRQRRLFPTPHFLSTCRTRRRLTNVSCSSIGCRSRARFLPPSTASPLSSTHRPSLPSPCLRCAAPSADPWRSPPTAARPDSARRVSHLRRPLRRRQHGPVRFRSLPPVFRFLPSSAPILAACRSSSARLRRSLKPSEFCTRQTAGRAIAERIS